MKFVVQHHYPTGWKACSKEFATRAEAEAALERFFVQYQLREHFRITEVK